jgi:hypothetical protein
MRIARIAMTRTRTSRSSINQKEQFDERDLDICPGS